MNVFDTIEIEDLIRYSIAVVFIIAFLFATAYSLWGWFLMILSWWNEEKVKWAVNHIRHAIFGVMFLFLILFCIPLLTKFMGFPYGEYAKPKAIFTSISEISDRIFWWTTSDSNLNFPWPETTLPSDFSNL